MQGTLYNFMMIHNTIRQADEIKYETRPVLKTRKFSTIQVEIFEHVLLSGKTNQVLNVQFGYTRRSHAVVDHSKKVMYKLLAFENLSRSEYQERITYPRQYSFWWNSLLKKHKQRMLEMAIETAYYLQA
ncbi:hypothetical protein SAMN05216524_108282 [Mucilaginibacter sp. OK098]|nr:hypothetical protein SAMN05216524_108282 [Mucilaginibacter sp. OK098]